MLGTYYYTVTTPQEVVAKDFSDGPYREAFLRERSPGDTRK